MKIDFKCREFVFTKSDCIYRILYENQNSPYLVSIFEDDIYRASYKSPCAVNKRDAEAHLVKIIKKYRQPCTNLNEFI